MAYAILQQAGYSSPPLRTHGFCSNPEKPGILLTFRRCCGPPVATASVEPPPSPSASPSPSLTPTPSHQTDSLKKQKQLLQRTVHRPSDIPPPPSPPKPRVGIFWDLDNKPPRVEAYDVAMSLRKLSEEFGEVVEMIAYANQHVFKYIPKYVRDARLKRKELDQLEAEGVVQPLEPYMCKICRQKFLIHVDLQNHILTFHERGRQRVARLLSSEDLTAENIRSLEAKRKRYMEGSRKVVIPAVGYDLDYELERAGFVVGLVTDDPQAADTVLKSCMWNSLTAESIDCFVLVSDDTDYEDVLVAAGKQGVHRVVFSEMSALKKSVDVWLSWFEVMTVEAQIAAAEAAKLYLSEFQRTQRRASQKVDVWRRIHNLLINETSESDEGKHILKINNVSSFFVSVTDSVQQLG